MLLLGFISSKTNGKPSCLKCINKYGIYHDKIDGTRVKSLGVAGNKYKFGS